MISRCNRGETASNCLSFLSIGNIPLHILHGDIGDVIVFGTAGIARATDNVHQATIIHDTLPKFMHG